MGTKNPAFDAYIEKSAAFAKPILKRLRKWVHEACPGVEEALKWGHPSFQHHGILCGMAAFKNHATFGFWKGSLVLEDAEKSDEAMGQFGKILSVLDLPDEKTFKTWVKKAAQLNEDGVKAPRRMAPNPKSPLAIPAYLAAALKKNKAAKAAFDKFPPSHKKEYVEWFEDAKSIATRDRRLAQGVEWMAEGKDRDWKYHK